MSIYTKLFNRMKKGIFCYRKETKNFWKGTLEEAFTDLKVIRILLETMFNKYTKQYCNEENCLSKFSTYPGEVKPSRTCCRCCYLDKGYYSGENEKLFAKLMRIKEKYWVNDERGYLSDKGCNIPGYLRSITCSTYLCSKIKEKIDNDVNFSNEDVPSYYSHVIEVLQIGDRISEIQNKISLFLLEREIYYCFKYTSPTFSLMNNLN